MILKNSGSPLPGGGSTMCRALELVSESLVQAGARQTAQGGG